MSVYRTLRLPGLAPTKTIADALKTYLPPASFPRYPRDSLHAAEELRFLKERRYTRYTITNNALD